MLCPSIGFRSQANLQEVYSQPLLPHHLSLPEKMANYVRALCVHLFVVKTQQGVSSEMGKGSEGEAFCRERLAACVWRGTACWLELADKMQSFQDSP